MARNEEKAQSMLYRFREAMMIEAGLKRDPNDKNPLLPEFCDRLPIAEQARRELLREISRKITKIQDRGIDEQQIRILNDELNEMTRRKFAWDKRIHELGGIQRRSVQMSDRLGLETPNVHGYFYFGRAKELPGVQEALNPHKEDVSSLAKQKQELQAKVDHKYYGFGEDEDLIMLQAESRAEEELANFNGPLADWVTNIPTILPKGTSVSKQPPALPSQHIPTQEEVKQYLINRRREALLAKLNNA